MTHEAPLKDTEAGPCTRYLSGRRALGAAPDEGGVTYAGMGGINDGTPTPPRLAAGRRR